MFGVIDFRVSLYFRGHSFSGVSVSIFGCKKSRVKEMGFNNMFAVKISRSRGKMEGEAPL
jgi:hypothetical protein